jgi:hypothetical protein
VEAFQTLLGTHPFEELGVVTGAAVEVDGQDWGTIASWKNSYNTAIEKLLEVNANN